jgi:hypothetical protein
MHGSLQARDTKRAATYSGTREIDGSILRPAAPAVPPRRFGVLGLVAILGVSLIGSLGLLVVTPSPAAAAVYNRCTTKTFDAYVTKGGVRKIKIHIVAKGCTYQRTYSDGSISCLKFTSYLGFKQPESYVDFLDSRVETNIYSWGHRYGTTTIEWNCGIGDDDGWSRIAQTWGGNYRYNRTWPLLDLEAKPRVRVTFQANRVIGGNPTITIGKVDGSDWVF